MPYKEKLKNPSPNPRKKPFYKVTNWSSYNKSLQKRGKLSLYFPSGDIKSQFINEEIYVPGVSGQQVTYMPTRLCHNTKNPKLPINKHLFHKITLS